jgi:hypothetical protein
LYGSSVTGIVETPAQACHVFVEGDVEEVDTPAPPRLDLGGCRIAKDRPPLAAQVTISRELVEASW